MFAATFDYCLLQGTSVLEVAIAASIAAGLKCSKRGSGIGVPSGDEIRRELARVSDVLLKELRMRETDRKNKE